MVCKGTREEFLRIERSAIPPAPISGSSVRQVWRPIVKSQWDVLCYRQNEQGTPTARIPTPDQSAAWAPPGRPTSRRWQVGTWGGPAHLSPMAGRALAC